MNMRLKTVVRFILMLGGLLTMVFGIITDKAMIKILLAAIGLAAVWISFTKFFRDEAQD